MFVESFLYGKYDKYEEVTKAIMFQGAVSEINSDESEIIYGEKAAKRKQGGEEYSTYGQKFEKDKPHHPIFKKVFV